MAADTETVQAVLAHLAANPSLITTRGKTKANGLDISGAVTMDAQARATFSGIQQDWANGPPKNASPGTIWLATNVQNNASVWQFIYLGSDLSAPWHFIGGAPWVSSNSSGAITADATWREIAVTGFTALTGNYFWNGQMSTAAAAVAGTQVFVGLFKNHAIQAGWGMNATVVSGQYTVCSPQLAISLAAGDVVTEGYNVSGGGTPTLNGITHTIIPVSIAP